MSYNSPSTKNLWTGTVKGLECSRDAVRSILAHLVCPIPQHVLGFKVILGSEVLVKERPLGLLCSNGRSFGNTPPQTELRHK